ncbi:hypothetical protein T07_4836 [Trichinella nelsoni]|uniref:Uncharacterized protein n=1 Tax=Trichinella nelsoni TaxID=6336 RepID=A0A0V0S3Q8_9BILA|nr:hypothetical protein T07_4836 [Trichinella nelsoni]
MEAQMENNDNINTTSSFPDSKMKRMSQKSINLINIFSSVIFFIHNFNYVKSESASEMAGSARDAASLTVILCLVCMSLKSISLVDKCC